MTTIPAWGDLLGNIVLSVAAAVLFAFIYFAKSRRNAIQYFVLALLAILLLVEFVASSWEGWIRVAPNFS